MKFFYDSQIRRFLLQFARMFTDIYIETAPDANGTKSLSRIPIRHGAMSRQVANILNQNSENISVPSPCFSYYIKSLSIDEKRRGDSTWISKINANERKFVDGEYTNEIGNRYSIERHMPIPYLLTVQLDIYTTSIDTKLQILEQILVLFNPSVQLQQNDNVLDWTSLFEVILTDTNWSTMSIPQGTESEKDISSLTFVLPIYITPPSKVKRQKLIEKIITNIHNVGTELDLSDEDLNINDFSSIPETVIVTPNDYKVSLGINSNANELLLLNKHGAVGPTWGELFDLYKQYPTENSYVVLKTNNNLETDDGDIIGKISESDDPKILLFTVDTDSLPTTITPISKIIDVSKQYPGNGLPVAQPGQRYLITSPNTNGEESATSYSNPWGILINENDIIEYNGTNWFISFNSNSTTNTIYVKNLENGDHFKFTNKTGWVYTYLGEYNNGYWKIYF